MTALGTDPNTYLGMYSRPQHARFDEHQAADVDPWTPRGRGQCDHGSSGPRGGYVIPLWPETICCIDKVVVVHDAERRWAKEEHLQLWRLLIEQMFTKSVVDHLASSELNHSFHYGRVRGGWQFHF